MFRIFTKLSLNRDYKQEILWSQPAHAVYAFVDVLAVGASEA